jgi:hypothetical protein
MVEEASGILQEQKSKNIGSFSLKHVVLKSRRLHSGCILWKVYQFVYMLYSE